MNRRYTKIDAELVVDPREVLETRPPTTPPPPAAEDQHEHEHDADNVPCTD